MKPELLERRVLAQRLRQSADSFITKLILWKSIDVSSARMKRWLQRRTAETKLLERGVSLERPRNSGDSLVADVVT